MKTRARGDFENNINDDEYLDDTLEYEDSDEEEVKEDRRREKGEIDGMSKMKKLMKTRARGAFKYNINDDEYQGNTHEYEDSDEEEEKEGRRREKGEIYEYE